MTRRGEGRSVNSTSPAKHERSRRTYLIRKGLLAAEEPEYYHIDLAFEAAGLL